VRVRVWLSVGEGVDNMWVRVWLSVGEGVGKDVGEGVGEVCTRLRRCVGECVCEYVARVNVCEKEVCGCRCRGMKCVGVCALYVWDGVRSVIYKDT